MRQRAGEAKAAAATEGKATAAAAKAGKKPAAAEERRRDSRIDAGTQPLWCPYGRRCQGASSYSLRTDHSLIVDHFLGAISLVLTRRSFELVGRTAVGERDGGQACDERGQAST